MDWTPKALPLKAIDTSNNLYKKVIGKSGSVWYYGDHEASGDDIFVSTEDKNGCGGRAIPFSLVTGESDNVRGVWKSSAEGLFSDTGIDLRQNYKTFVVISKYHRWERGRETFKDVIYIDDEPLIGEHNRGVELAKAFSFELHADIWYYVQTSGGSVSGCIDGSRSWKN